MALLNRKVVSLTSESRVGETVVARLSATVNSETDVNSGYSEQITDIPLYNANKAQVRKDMDDFRQMVYDLEDELAAEDEATVPEETPETTPEEPVEGAPIE